MPTYDYVCKLCEHAFEHFQGINDKRLRTCPECNKRGLERLIGSGAGVVFKGSGFYETDYKRAGRPDSDGKDGASKSDSGADKTSGSDTDSSGSGSGSDKSTSDSSAKKKSS